MTTIEQIDPARAAVYLACNTGNRPLDPARVQRFARAIRRGRWQADRGAIEFAADGRLVNGQHRLFAIVATGRTLAVAVRRRTEEAAA